MNNNTPELILVVIGIVMLVTMCTAVQAREVTPANITLEEYDVLCPEVDFSPMHPICDRVRIRTYCPPQVDFSPPRPPNCIRTICPETDFSPQPEECLDEEDNFNSTDFGPHF